MNKKTRLTKQKKIVLDEVLNRMDHPTAYQIYDSIHEKYPSISRSTVYRNLDILAREGKIKHITLPTTSHFDLTVKNHYHVLCKHCGKLIDTGIEYRETFDKRVEQETGFKIFDHSLVFEGICPKCQRKLKEDEKRG